MGVQSNINLYYEELIDSMAERAIDNADDGGYGDEYECIWQAIDDGLMYYCDRGYVLAMAICRGYVDWGKEIQWDKISEMLYEDVSEQVEYLRKKKGE